MTHYFLQRADDHKLWEEVDELVYKDFAHAVGKDGQPRYSGNRILQDGNHHNMDLEGVSQEELAIICRFLGIREQMAPGSVPGGFLRRPEYVKLSYISNKKLGQHREVLHEIGGQSFKVAG